MAKTSRQGPNSLRHLKNKTVKCVGRMRTHWHQTLKRLCATLCCIILWSLMGKSITKFRGATHSDCSRSLRCKEWADGYFLVIRCSSTPRKCSHVAFARSVQLSTFILPRTHKTEMPCCQFVPSRPSRSSLHPLSCCDIWVQAFLGSWIICLFFIYVFLMIAMCCLFVFFQWCLNS